ncbi:MAG: hypothetical protein ACXAES_03955 [Promethearchaeota archaeon]
MLLKSEVEVIDFGKNFINKRIYCPFCKNSMLKILDSNNFYNKYQCWYKSCENNNIPFIVLNEFLQYEHLFKTECENCGESYNRDRELTINGNNGLYINFSCSENNCKTNLKPYRYNIYRGDWEDVPPPFLEHTHKTNLKKANNIDNEETTQKFQMKNTNLQDLITSDLKEISNHSLKIEEMPLLDMEEKQFNKFLKNHKGKVVILVDLPDFIRSLRDIIPFNFEFVLEKAHALLLEFIKNSFRITNEYIIHFFSYPYEDLELPNKQIINFCLNNRGKEHFHILNIPNELVSSTIDNYLIAIGVGILERYEIKGFMVVCNNKDYLPLLRLASYKNIKARVLGINTPKIYEKYNISTTKFLKLIKFFEIPSS